MEYTAYSKLYSKAWRAVHFLGKYDIFAWFFDVCTIKRSSTRSLSWAEWVGQLKRYVAATCWQSPFEAFFFLRPLKIPTPSAAQRSLSLLHTHSHTGRVCVREREGGREREASKHNAQDLHLFFPPMWSYLHSTVLSTISWTIFFTRPCSEYATMAWTTSVYIISNWLLSKCMTLCFI